MITIGTISSSDKSVPNAPTIGTATNVGSGRAFNNGRGDVTFTAPGYTGRLPITGYTVTSSPGGFTGAGSGSPITVTGLQSNTAYTFTVTGTNSVGTSVASSASTSITATTVPQAPTIGTATDGGTGTTVSVPFSGNATGGSAITGYTATSSPGGITGTGAGSPITVSGLTTGTAYTFTVTATNVNGTSTASAASNSVTPIQPTAFDSISSVVLGSDTTVTFSSIPSTYVALQLRIMSAGASSRDIGIFFNGDTSSANYYSGYLYATSSGLPSVSFGQFDRPQAGWQASWSNEPGFYNGFTLDILDYASTSKQKTWISQGGVVTPGAMSSTPTGLFYGNWQNTAAINSITLSTFNTNFKSGTIVALYGIKG